jgi:ribosome-binding factor A
MPGYRKERLEKLIRMIVSDALLKDVKDPRIGFVTVTKVELNKDKSVAYVSVSVLGDEKAKKNSMIGLNSAKGYFQFKVGKGIEIRNTPKVVFKLDSSIEYESQMLGTLDKLNLEEGRTGEDLSVPENEDEEQ